MPSPRFTGLLVRVPAGAAGALPAARTLAAADAEFELEPLFTLPAGESLDFGPRAAVEWHVARPTGAMQGAHAWEVAHAMREASVGLAAADVYIEPDLEQQWLYENPADRSGLLGAGETCVFNDQRTSLPHTVGAFAWHLRSDYTQLADARAAAAGVHGSPTVRIAHLDTGFDPHHSTRPIRLRADLQRNFVGDQADSDARDPGARGALKNPGHGTGTLGLLAGARFTLNAHGYQFDAPLGGAPDAEVVPVRVGDSVVHFRTSGLAKGLAYAAALATDDATRVHVVSLSMGGVASAAWADAVNLAYEAGIVLVAAAGNNYSAGFFGFPTHFIVYPARFRRVIAACGAMADRRPYYGLPAGTMQGNWGPDSKMATALAGYTPNTAWAELGCPGIVDMEGSGTSSATPQVAAAAALYLQRHGLALFDPAQYPEPWMRVEAVRQALFSGADKLADGGSPKMLGNGLLRAARALAVAPAARSVLQKTAPDGAAFPFLRVLTGLGITDDVITERMLMLEATQLALQWERESAPSPLELAVSDPDLPAEAVPIEQTRKYHDGLLEHPAASRQLKARVEQVRRALYGTTPVPRKPKRRKGATALPPADAPARFASARAPFLPPSPPFRYLRGFSIDPSLATALETAPISEIVLKLPWERLAPGPTGEYLEVVDVDPPSGCVYDAVDLDDPRIIAQQGLAPSEGTPQFHQQMVYAVARLTIANFERALGRRTLWRPRPLPNASPKNDAVFVPKLRIYPHALRERNAYYSPQKIALLFGYFNATREEPGRVLPGAVTFTCLSHDIIAHETTHAILDGMHRRFVQPTNPDVRAFHEAFADIVALFQHFTFPAVLRHQIAATRGDIRAHESLLGQLAGEFGRASGLRGALRSFIGQLKDGAWVPHKPDPAEYEHSVRPHARGAILVAAVFDAFVSIYERRTADLLRLATGGSGILQPGALHPDLVDRLSHDAAKSAQHVLTMCIRALDYCPPVDITFGEYLRAILTADVDLVPDDDLQYRVAFVEAFRRRGIYPRDVRTLSVESLRWRGPRDDDRAPSKTLEGCLVRLREYAQEYLYAYSAEGIVEPREQVFQLQRAVRRDLHAWLRDHFASGAEGQRDAAFLGLDAGRSFEVHTARFALRATPDGGVEPQTLIGILQERTEPVDPRDPSGPTMRFEGGCTIVGDLRRQAIRYCIRKNLNSVTRLGIQQTFAMSLRDSPRETYFNGDPLGVDAEPFAALHRGL